MNRLKGTKGDAEVCGCRVYIKGVKRGEGGKNTHGEGGEGGGGLRRYVHSGMRLAIKNSQEE